MAGTTTRRVLRTRVAEAIGDQQSLTTTTLGSTTTLISTSFKDLPGGSDDDGFKGFYEYQTSGNNENEYRRASPATGDAFTQSTNTLTLARAHTNAVASGVTFELYRYDPTDYHTAIRQAISDAYPQLYLPLRDETLLVDNLLLNPDFEDGSFTSWTSAGGPTISAETSIKMHGAQSLKLLGGGGVVQQTQTLTVNIRELTGKSVRFPCWLYTTVGGTSRIRLDWGSSNFSNSSYHTGTDQWELLILTAAVPSTATQMKAIIETTGGVSTPAYFDAASLTILPVYRYIIPSTMLKGPYYVTQQADEYDPSGPYYPLSGRNYPVAGRRLRLEGVGLLTNPASDTATIEIGAPQTDYLVALAARNLNRILASRAAAQQRDRYLADMEMWEQEARKLLSVPGIAMPRLGAQDSRGIWHTEESSTERLLILDQAR